MKLKNVQIVKLVSALALGALFGTFCKEWLAVTDIFRHVFKTGIGLLVPFIVFGFVASSIANAGRGAGKLLLTTLGIAFLTTIAAGVFALVVSGWTLPGLLHGSFASHAKAVAGTGYGGAIPTCVALALAIAVGLLNANGRSSRLGNAVMRFKGIVSSLVSKVVAPLMPIYVFTVVAGMVANEQIRGMGGDCVRIMIVAVLSTTAATVLLYVAASFVTGRNPLRALCNMIPAYLAGCGSCSSVASIPYTLKHVQENGVSEQTAELVIPLCSSVHHVGSVVNLVVYVVGLAVLTGEMLPMHVFMEYVILVAVVSFLTPGIPGGVALASAWVAQSVLGFSPDQYAFVIAIYLVLDGVGTACNLTCDGAVAMMVEKIMRRNVIVHGDFLVRDERLIPLVKRAA